MKTKGGASIRAAVATAVLLALLVVGVVYAATVTVDTFDAGGENYTVTRGDSGSSVTSTLCLGGERDTTLNAYSYDVSLRVDQYNSNRLAIDASSDATYTATVTWDGADGDAWVLAGTGLGGVNVVSGTNNSFVLSIVSKDEGRIGLTLRVYTGTNASELTLTMPAARVGSGERVDLVYPFSQFSTIGGSGADFTSVGAIQLYFNGTLATATDIAIDNLEASSAREYGDLPVSIYGTSVLSACHIPQGMRLGANVETESTYQSSTNADGDDAVSGRNIDDEDGVAINMDYWPWSPGSGGGELDITVTGCGSGNDRCYVHGWIDWNGDGDFNDTVNGANEKIIAFTTGSDGTSERTFTTPDPFPNGYYYARFRICPHGGNNGAACDSPTTADNNVTNGEVEDYRWPLGPTAVIINSFTARPESGGIRLTWQTADETDLVGFDLLRSLAEGGPYLPLNGEAIPAQHPGRPEGATYSWLDGEVLGGLTCYYRLDIHDKDGQTTPFGPVSATAWYRLYLPLVLR